MRYRSATVAGSHGLPLNPEREKNTNGKSRGTAPARRNTFFSARPPRRHGRRGPQHPPDLAPGMRAVAPTAPALTDRRRNQESVTGPESRR